MNKQFSFVSIIIPMHNEGDYIKACLESALAQDYPSEYLEVLVIDGRSTDHSPAIVSHYIQENPPIHLLDNPRQTTSTALNMGITCARGQYIVRVDAHTVLSPDYVRRCVELLDSSGAANVGGLMRPVGVTYVGKAVALATTTPFGIGNSKFHYDAQEQLVDTVYMGAFRRDIFDQVGLFDEELIRNQDYELNIRIRKAGGKILLSPKIISHYTPRSSLIALWKQYFQYGRWKVRTLQKHPNSLRWRQTAPPLFVTAVFSSLLLGFFWPSARWLLIFVLSSYLLANLVASTIAASRGGWQFFPVLPLTFVVIHFAWGLGFLYGLVLLLFTARK